MERERREIPDGCENKGHVGGERRREDPGSGATRHWGPCGGFAGKAAGIHREKGRMADKNRDTKPETGLEEKADASEVRETGRDRGEGTKLERLRLGGQQSWVRQGQRWETPGQRQRLTAVVP